MKTDQTYVCNTLQDVYKNTKLLDKSKLVDLQINDGGVIKNVDNFKGVYNISQGRFCNVVTPHYNLVQHREYFDAFTTALNNLNIKFTSTITQIGDKAIMDFNFSGRNIKFKEVGEEFTTGLRIINSYNKQTGLFVVPKFMRLACTNGMVITKFSDEISIKHTQIMAREIHSFVERKINELINKSDELKLWVSDCMKDSIEWLTVCKIITQLFKQPKHRDEILKLLGIDVVIITDKKTKKELLQFVWTDKTKQQEKITRWSVYNAVTQYITHSEQVTPHIENFLQGYAEKILVNPLKSFKVSVI